VLDVQYHSRERSYALQDKMSELNRSELEARIAALLDAYDQSPDLLQIDRLEIDTGRIPEAQLETEFPQRVIDALRQELDKLLSRIAQKQEGDYGQQSLAEAYTGYLAHYLQQGYLPWQVSGANADPAQWIAFLAEHDPAGLVELIRRLGRNEQIRQRMAMQLSEPSIFRIIGLLEPGYAQFIIDFIAATVKHEEIQQQVSEDEYASAKHYFVLTYLLVERGSGFNTRMFARSVIRQMADRYNLQYRDLLLRFYRDIQTSSIRQRNTLLDLISRLYADEMGAAGAPVWSSLAGETGTEEPAQERDIPGLDALFYFLTNGFLSPGHYHLGVQQLEQVLEEAVQKTPATLRRLLGMMQPQQLWQYAGRFFSTQSFTALLKLYQPAEASWMSSRAAGLQVAGADERPLAPAQRIRLEALVLRLAVEQRGQVLNQTHFADALAIWLRKEKLDTPARMEALYKGLGQTGTPATTQNDQTLPQKQKAENAQKHQQVSTQNDALKEEANTGETDEEQSAEKLPTRLMPDEIQRESEAEKETDKSTGNMHEQLEKVFDAAEQHRARNEQTGADVHEQAQHMAAGHDQGKIVETQQGGMQNKQDATQTSPKENRGANNELQTAVGKENAAEDAQTEGSKTSRRSNAPDSHELTNPVRTDAEAEQWTEEGIVAKSGIQNREEDRTTNKKNPALREETIGITKQAHEMLTQQHSEQLQKNKHLPESNGHEERKKPGHEYTGIDSAKEPLHELTNTQDLFADPEEEYMASPDAEEERRLGEVSDRPTWTNDAEKAYQLLHYFLSTGKLPWWNTLVRTTQQLRQLWEQQLQADPQLTAWLAAAIMLRPVRNQILRVFENDEEALFDSVSPAVDTEDRSEEPAAVYFRELSAPVAALLAELALLYRFVPASSRAQQLEAHFRKEAAALAIGLGGVSAQLRQAAKDHPGLYFHPLFGTLLQWLDPVAKEETGTQGQASGSSIEEADQDIQPFSRKATEKEPPALSGPKHFPAAIRRNPIVVQQVEALLLFMQSGQLSAVNPFGGIDRLLALLHGALRQEPGILWQIPLLRSLLSGASGRERLAGAMNTDTRLYFLELSWQRYDPQIALYTYDMEQMLAIPGLADEAQIRPQQLSEALLAFVAEHGMQPRNDRQFVQFVLKNLFSSAMSYQHALGRFKVKLLKKEIVPKSHLPALLEKTIPATEKKPDMKPDKRKDPEPGHETRPVFIENAGLILCWPFLPFYFTQLGLLHGNQFVSAEASYRAVHLLEYLCLGLEHQPEYKLVLNKLLAGVEQAKPISLKVDLGEVEKDLSQTLLQQVIARWDALKNTSVEGLRESFLKRPGKLSWIDGQATLQVEKRPFDMLLDRIPWSISHIKLSWMKEPLKVNWR